MKAWRNWSGAVTCRPQEIARPADADGVRQLLAKAREQGRTVRAVGAGHSFTPLCATGDILLSLDRLSGVTAVDGIRARTGAGTRLGTLNRALADHGLALANLGDIDVQAIAGAVATGTHGTGLKFGNLATQVAGMRLVTADGESLWCDADENAEIFHAGRIHLGALGVVTELALDCVPAYRLRYRSERAGLEDTLGRLDEFNAAHRNFEFYWFPHTATVQRKFLDATEEPATHGHWRRRLQDLVVENGAFWVLSEAVRRLPGADRPAAHLAAATVPAHRQVRPAHQIYATRRLVRFNETEYNLPAAALPEALRSLAAMIERKRIKVHFPVECRFAAGDDIPLSPAYGRESAYIAVHMYKNMDHAAYFREAEAIFDDFDGRPHWGKMHSKTAADFERLYPEWTRFQELRRRLDPEGLFLNDHLRAVFG